MIRTLNFSFPLVDEKGFASDAFIEWYQNASLSIPIVGTGSPEGVVTARQYQLYIDEAGAPSAIEYRKILPEIGGDKSQGWVLV